VDGERSSSLIKGIHLGVLAPGVSISKTIHLFNTGAGGDRMIDISLQTRTKVSHAAEEEEEEGEDDEDDTDTKDSANDMMEHLKLLTVPTVNALRVAYDVVYRRDTTPWPGLADLDTFDKSFWDTRHGGEVLLTATMTSEGPSSLSIESVTLQREVRIFFHVVTALAKSEIPRILLTQKL